MEKVLFLCYNDAEFTERIFYMERIVKVSVFEFSTTWASSFYINKYHDYGIECHVISRNLGILFDRYILRLKGKPENIQLYLDYLKAEKFKIH